MYEFLYFKYLQIFFLNKNYLQTWLIDTINYLLFKFDRTCLPCFSCWFRSNQLCSMTKANSSCTSMVLIFRPKQLSNQLDGLPQESKRSFQNKNDLTSWLLYMIRCVYPESRRYKYASDCKWLGTRQAIMTLYGRDRSSHQRL